MKKALAIFFLIIYLSSTTELAQLWKIPMLIEHFSEHKSQNPQISFADFMLLHYQDEAKNTPETDQDNDHDKDQQLPFIGHISPLNLAFIQPEIWRVLYFRAKVLPKFITHFFMYQDAFFPKASAKAIWQPPRFL